MSNKLDQILSVFDDTEEFTIRASKNPSKGAEVRNLLDSFRVEEEPEVQSESLTAIIEKHKSKAVYDDIHPIYQTHKIHDINIQYVSAPCAAGKTYALIQHFKTDPTGKYLVAVPTKKLAEQYREDLMAIPELTGRTQVIHGGDINNIVPNVPALLQDALANAQTGAIIVCTQAAINLINNAIVPHDFTYIFDEIPTVVHTHKKMLPYNHELFTQFMKSDDLLEVDNLLKITALDMKKVQAFFQLNQDSINDYVKDIMVHLKNEDALFAHKETYNKLTAGIISPDEEFLTEHGNEKNTFYFVGINNPRHLAERKVIMMGADFEDSLLFYAWKEFYGVSFSKNFSITNKLRYTEHTEAQGSLVSIFYDQEGFATGGASRKIRKDGKSYLQKRFTTAQDIFDDMDVYAITNLKDQNQIPENFDVVSSKCHGDNSYSNYRAVMLSVCINVDNTLQSILTAIGITPTMFKLAEHMQTNYQGAMRCALRDITNTDPIYIFTADSETAAFMQSKLKGSTIYTSEGREIFNPQLLDCRTRTEKQAAKRHDDKIKNKLTTQSDTEIFSHFVITSNELDPVTNREKTDEVSMNKDVMVTWTAFKDTKDVRNKCNNVMNADGSYGYTESACAFVTQMRGDHKNNRYKSKEQNMMITMCSYNGVGADHEKINYKTAIVLDVDGKDYYDSYMTADELNGILKDNKIPHIIHSSSSNTAERQKYRAYIFVNRPMNLLEHEGMYKYVIKLIEDAGFKSFGRGNKGIEAVQMEWLQNNPTGKFSGIDAASGVYGQRYFTAGRLLNGRDEDMIWLEGFVDKNRVIARYALDVDAIAVPYVVEKLEAERIEAERITNVSTVTTFDTTTKLGRIQKQLADNAAANEHEANLSKRIKLLQQIDSNINYNDNRQDCAVQIAGYISLITDKDIRTELVTALYNRLEATGGIDPKGNLKKSVNNYAKV